MERLTSGRTVNHIIDINGEPLYFDRVIYRPREGFPVNQEVVLYTDSDIECCEACQTTVSATPPTPNVLAFFFLLACISAFVGNSNS